MATWNLQPSDRFCDSLWHYRADKAVINNWRHLSASMARSDNPASMGVPKKGRYGGCLGTSITKSVVLVYRIDYAARRIDLLDMGDHKRVYGRDG